MTLTATTLTANLSASATDMDVAAAISDDAEGDFLVQIDEEYVLVEWRGLTRNPQIRRAMYSTTAATHSSSEDVTPVIPTVGTGDPADPPGGGGGGGVTVDNTVDPPSAIANLIAPGAAITGDTADLSGRLQMRLLRSANLTYQTVGIANSGGSDPIVVRPFSVSGGEVAVGDVIFDVWLEVTEFFDGPGHAVTHVVAMNDDETHQDLFAVRPDLAFDKFENNNAGGITSMGMADRLTSLDADAPILDVRTNSAANAQRGEGFIRVLPAAVLTSGFGIGIFIAENPFNQTQGQMRLYALVGTPS